MATNQPPQKTAAQQIAEGNDDAGDEAAAAEIAALGAEQPSEAPVKRKRAKEVAAAAPRERFMICRVTRRGADKLSTGNHFPTEGDEFFAQGETIVLPESVANEQEHGIDRLGEEKNYVDIVGEASPDQVKAFFAKTLVKQSV